MSELKIVRSTPKVDNYCIKILPDQEIAVIVASCDMFGLPGDVKSQQELIIAITDVPKLRDLLIKWCDSLGLKG